MLLEGFMLLLQMEVLLKSKIAIMVVAQAFGGRGRGRHHLCPRYPEVEGV
jgi:hypothetical protein